MSEAEEVADYIAATGRGKLMRARLIACMKVYQLSLVEIARLPNAGLKAKPNIGRKTRDLAIEIVAARAKA